MQQSSLIGHIVELLDLIHALKQPADTIVTNFLRSRHYLGSKDRRFINGMVFGVLRNWRLLEHFIMKSAEVLGTTFPQPIPSVAYCTVYRLKIEEQETEQIRESIEGLWRVYIPDVEFQTFLTQTSAIEFPLEGARSEPCGIAIRYSFPDFIVQEWAGRFGVAETNQLCAALNEEAPITVRVNSLKTDVETCARALLTEGVISRRTNLSPDALVLEKRVNVHSLKSFKDGFFEMQDEGSQILSYLLDARPGMHIVDACAGSGGKTLHIAAIMKNLGKITALDVDRNRLARMRDRLTRCGISIVEIRHVEHDDASIQVLSGKADAVLVDAPCSGVGVARRNPGAKLFMTRELVEKFSLTQHSVLGKYANLVKPGGRLVYATCTLLRKENEEVVDRFLSVRSEFELLSVPEILHRQGIPLPATSTELMLSPHRNTTDGFFAAVMQRKSCILR
jgi:16S rRNA (cytosine967-C5)-methyltransferase